MELTFINIFLLWWGIGFIGSLIGEKLLRKCIFRYHATKITIGDVLIAILSGFGGIFTIIYYIFSILSEKCVFSDIGYWIDDTWDNFTNWVTRVLDKELF